MKKQIKDLLLTAGILAACFLCSLATNRISQTPMLIPMFFVLGVFLISVLTSGYRWGVAASLLSVLAVNFAFTFPYFEFNFSIPVNFFSAVVMLVVAIVTCALTKKITYAEKLKADSEREKMRANLLRAVSHDLRTPLTSIYGSCSAMIENFDTIPRQKQLMLLKDMQTDAQWLKRMVENLLSVTRVDADTVRLSKHAVVLEELVDALIVKFRKHYPDQLVQVSIPEEFVSIPMDPVLIEQVLMNLLENAVFHAHGMENLWLRVEVREGKAHFFVEDDGCGIADDRMAQLFTGISDREIKADSGRSNMGIGLSVCRTIIKAHGGELKAGNRPDGGAVFRFALEMEENEHVQQ